MIVTVTPRRESESECLGFVAPRVTKDAATPQKKAGPWRTTWSIFRRRPSYFHYFGEGICIMMVIDFNST